MESGSGRAIVHLLGDGRPIDMGAFGMTVKADASDTAGSFSLLEAAEPPGFGPPCTTCRFSVPSPRATPNAAKRRYDSVPSGAQRCCCRSGTLVAPRLTSEGDACRIH